MNKDDLVKRLRLGASMARGRTNENPDFARIADEAADALSRQSNKTRVQDKGKEMNAKDLRNHLMANMFDGEDGGMLTMKTSYLLDEVVELALQYYNREGK